jgi:hypothetical protein
MQLQRVLDTGRVGIYVTMYGAKLSERARGVSR